MMHPKILWTYCCILFIFSLSGCTTTKPIVKKPAPIPSLPEQIQAQLPKEYCIQPGNELLIKFLDNPELNEKVTVRPDGRISIQLAHEIMVANKTPAEVTDELTSIIESELENPHITVIVSSFKAQKIYVGGEVTEPQVVDLEQGSTALQAIFQARGFTSSARTNEVILIRRQSDYTPVAMTLNLSHVLDGTNMKQDVLLMPHDIIFVPKTPIADANQWVEQHIRNLIPLETLFNVSYDFYK